MTITGGFVSCLARASPVATLALTAVGAMSLAGGASAQAQWQKPGAIQRPTGPWQTPGATQKAGPIQTVQHGCERRLIVAGDALFEFNKSALTAAAARSLAVLGPKVAQAGHPAEVIEGHTDSVGGAAYNLALSDARARSVRDWLAARHYVSPALATKGYGAARPVAPNAKPDGTDNPQGRALNRRVEVVIKTCN